MSNPFYHPQKYFAQALDPIHIGTGGERLSRVDLAIVREAGTDLPKLPGTSLSGACRAYAAMQRKEGELGRNCAGQGGEKHIIEGKEVKQHCGKPECPICQTFGFAKGNTGGQKGVAQFTDAHIIAFPVATTNGPLWVTSVDALAHVSNAKIDEPDQGVIQSKDDTLGSVIAVGWLALKYAPLASQLPPIPQLEMRRLALVPSALFPTIVNDNLEVRTSVAIDPGTGAAEEGALFTYEAIPTGTIFAFTVIYQPKEWERDPKPPKSPPKTVEDGLSLFEWLGVGGMNTRGMGRLSVLGLEAKA